MDFACSSSTIGEITTLSVRGELDMLTSPTLCTALDGLDAAGHHHLVVDLTDLTFLDSTGIGALVSYSTKARERGGSLRIANPSGMPRRALEVTGVLELLSGSGEVDEPAT